MTKGEIMQLLILALLAISMGRNTNFNQFKPILESFGGEEATNAIKQAEELSGIISALRAITAPPENEGCGAQPPRGDNPGGEEQFRTDFGGYPLAPIANIADDKITCCLSRYIALGE